MKKILYLSFICLVFSCSSKKTEDPLVLPPNFDEMPDLNNPEKPSADQKDRGVERLKELLLQSDD